MNMYLHELRSYRKNTIIWTVSIGAVTLFFFSMFPAFSKSAEDVVKIFMQYPKAVREAFGFPVDLIGTVSGYYSFILTFIVLCGAVQAMNLGISIVAKETTGKTVDFLLTKPVTRSAVITSKYLAALTCVLITSGVYLLVASVTAAAFSAQEFDYTPFLMMTLTFLFVEVMFMTLGFFVAVNIPKIRSVLPVSLSTVFGFFIIGIVGATLSEKTLYWFTPFKYFDALYIIQHSAYELPYIIVGVVFVAVAVLMSYVLYSRKDIHAV